MVVSLTSVAPLVLRRACSTSEFSMMPLCTTAMRPAVSVCGWAFVSFGSPWVAQRVCPTPVVALAARSLSLSLRSWTRPAVLVTWSRPRWMTARPAESYPRYSSRCSPSTRTGVASRLPTYPTIPHTLLVPPQWSAWLSVWLSAVHHAPQLALGQLRGPEPAAPELGRDQWPDLIVLLVLLLEFGMPPFHELVNGLPEVRGDVRHHSPSGRLGQPGRGRDMAEQLMRVV